MVFTLCTLMGCQCSNFLCRKKQLILSESSVYCNLVMFVLMKKQRKQLLLFLKFWSTPQALKKRCRVKVLHSRVWCWCCSPYELSFCLSKKWEYVTVQTFELLSTDQYSPKWPSSWELHILMIYFNNSFISSKPKYCHSVTDLIFHIY